MDHSVRTWGITAPRHDETTTPNAPLPGRRARMTAAVRQHVKHDEPTLITAGIAGFAGFALAAILLVPEHLL